MESIEITINTLDRDRAVEFWCAALGYRLRYHRGSYAVLAPSTGAGPQVVVQAVDPASVGAGGVHFDLRVADPAATVARLLELGARRRADVEDAGRRWTVLTDPDGNPFCVCPSR